MNARSSLPSRATINDKFVSPFVIDDGKGFDLSGRSTAEKGGIDKDASRPIMDLNRERLQSLQEMLYAQNTWSLLLIFQGMDASGKDSAIRAVFEGVNPQGCDVTSFKAPSTLELDHDFLWRCAVRLPERGRIGIFNRSYYEECLIARVHKDVLAKQKLPPELVTADIWRERFEDISAFERHLARNGTVILKFFLNVSKEEQRQRFLDRIEEPEKNWKFSVQDVNERKHWDDYQHAYADMIAHTSSKHAPWLVVPADHKWFARLVISSAIVRTLDQLDLKVPRVDEASLKEFAMARSVLEQEGRSGAGRGPSKTARNGSKPPASASKHGPTKSGAAHGRSGD
jgi:PPK2 family polyphosphate:nucleotide phosphotransferase